MQTEAEFLQLPVAAFDVDAARQPPDRGDEGPIYAAFIAISRPTRRTAFRRSGRIFSRWAPWGSWRAHLLFKCFAK
jgi:hypothetical protein